MYMYECIYRALYLFCVFLWFRFRHKSKSEKPRDEGKSDDSFVVVPTNGATPTSFIKGEELDTAKNQGINH